jgi:hypothetical protein
MIQAVATVELARQRAGLFFSTVHLADARHESLRAAMPNQNNPVARPIA